MTLQDIIETITSIKNLGDKAIDDRSVRLTEDQQELLSIIQRSTKLVLEFLPQYEEDVDSSEDVPVLLIFDLRTPLNNFINASEMLLNPDVSWNYAPLSKLQEDNLRQINTSAQQVLEFLLSIVAKHREEHIPHDDNESRQ